MNFKVQSKHNVGDYLYVWHLITNNLSSLQWHMGYEKLQVSHIRVTYGNDINYRIEYFFEGLTSYEGENWFNEETEDPEYQCIFATEAEAKEFEQQYKEKHKEE